MTFAVWITSQVAFNGLVRGMVYGLLAMSIVLIYRSSKVINFAVGAMGLIGSGLLVLLNVRSNVPYWISLIVALAAGILYSVVIELIVVRRLFRAPRVILLVATIGVSQLSQAVLFAFPDIKGRAPYPLPIDGLWEVGDLRMKSSHLTVIVVAPLVALALGWFLSQTLIGRVIRASATNPDLARLRGVNPKFVSTVVWGIAGGVGTISMILVGGVDGTAANLSNLGPTTLLRALAAALIARFVSFRIALLVGVVIGLVEAVVQFNYLTTPGLIDALLLLAVIAVVAGWLRERDSSVFAFNPKVDVLPERLRSVPWVRNLDRIAMLIPLGLAIGLPFVFTLASQHVLYASIGAFTICALSLTVLTGWAGQLSLGQMSFAALGALLASAFSRGLTIDWSIGTSQLIYLRFEPFPYAWSIVAAVAITAIVAAAIGSGALRISGLLLAVSTFAFAVAAASYFYRITIFTEGRGGAILFPRGSPFGLDLQNHRTYYFAVLTMLVIVVAVLGRLRRSAVGRVTIAVRDNDVSAAAYTIRPAVVKLRSFALSGAIAALGGALLVGVSQRFSFGDGRFLVEGSLLVVAMVVIGGMGSLGGAIIGSIWVVGLPSALPDNEIIPLLTSSLGLLILLLYFPGGFVHVLHRVRGAIYRRMEKRLPPVEKSAVAPPASVGVERKGTDVHPVPLRTSDIEVSFGGLMANDGISIEVRSEEVVGLIGTNGAGKTTLMNAMGGFVRSTGQVELLGADVSKMAPAQRARLGMGRTFQTATLFPELTVRETVLVALEARGRTGMIETMLFSPRVAALSRVQRRQVDELVDFLGLGRYAEKPISELSTGTRRIVELAGLLALGAQVLCLDEPTAGIAQREAEAMGPLLLEIRQELRASMLIIEHDMPFIMGMSDRVYCLELGKVISEGDPATVRSDPKVIASYLGMDERAIQRSGKTSQ